VSHPSQREGATANARNVLVLETDPATRALFAEWLDAEGWQVLDPSSADAAAPLALIVLELAFLRDAGLQPLAEVKRRYPRVPIVVVSPTLFASVGCCGPCAAALGVAGVLAKPIARATLIEAVQRLARPGSR
jgi:CheY-like chemotaxis protein